MGQADLALGRRVSICGIAGLVGEQANRETLLRMLDAIKHRGHDDVGTYVDDHVGLGCDRLAIVDVAGGHQPASNEAGTIWVVLNGEVYNHRELRALLQQYGHRFNCLSDTEVIAHAYEEWGEETFEKLQGMFALAVWDKNKHTMLVARDRVGIKPLYFAQADLTFAFASEAKAILSAGLIDTPTVNDIAVAQLLQVGYLLAPMSMLKEVKQLSPASYLRYAEGRISVKEYWNPPPYDERVPSVEAIREVLKNSIVRQTETSDVPVAAFLSGGLDTSTVVAFASKARSERLQTFCMGFGEHTDEFSDAKLVADEFGTDHHELLIDASDAMHVFPRMIWHSEMPKVNLYSWFVDEAASRFGKVCLSGLGGDELFCGYPTSSRFKRARQFSRIQRLPLARTLATAASMVPTERGRYAKAITSETLAYSTIITGLPPSEIHRTIPDHVRPYFSGSGDFLQKVIGCEFHTKLPYDYLLVEDGMSMAHTLEVRVPLLDDLLLQLMLGVPYGYQMTMNSGKLLLRSAMKGILPERCFAKPKWGFSIDIYSWWKNTVREYAEKSLPESKIVKQLAGRWHQKVLQKTRLPMSPSRTRWYTMAWMMLGLDLWHRIFIDDHGKEPKFSW